MRRLNKEYKLNVCRHISMRYGSVNKKDPRVIYISGKCWLEPSEQDDYVQVIKSLENEFKKNVKLFLANGKSFGKRFILDFHANADSMEQGSKTYMSFDLYLRQSDKDVQPLEALQDTLSKYASTLSNSFVYACARHGLSATKNKNNSYERNYTFD